MLVCRVLIFNKVWFFYLKKKKLLGSEMRYIPTGFYIFPTIVKNLFCRIHLEAFGDISAYAASEVRGVTRLDLRGSVRLTVRHVEFRDDPPCWEIRGKYASFLDTR
jgi:hypothetical protein